jgi:hypothetical protein
MNLGKRAAVWLLRFAVYQPPPAPVQICPYARCRTLGAATRIDGAARVPGRPVDDL